MGKMLSPVLAIVDQADYLDAPRYAHWCVGCNQRHEIAVDTPFHNGARWSFDGNVEKPTFSPSINIRMGPLRDGRILVCHYFVRAGQIIYCGDCTHDLKNKTVDLAPFPAEQVRRIEMNQRTYALAAAVDESE